MSTYWALSGFSYLRYLNRATTVMRQSVKEPLKSQLLARERVTLKKFTIARRNPTCRGACTEHVYLLGPFWIFLSSILEPGYNCDEAVGQGAP
mmetsp:Transcript_17811/g.34504  ORF Transcript_17811/g.34504 Transcript_17811/m.34504 type:complete len:93 (+) Transcript_17811:86-364(+)